MHVMNCGDVSCREGDYLLQKTSGEVYPIEEQEFLATYETEGAGGCGASCQGAKRLPRSLMLALTLTQCLSLFLEVGDLDWPRNLAVWCM